jgi:hypothetical protein
LPRLQKPAKRHGPWEKWQQARMRRLSCKRSTGLHNTKRRDIVLL